MAKKSKKKVISHDIDYVIKKNELQSRVLEKIIKKINQSKSLKNEEKNFRNNENDTN